MNRQKYHLFSEILEYPGPKLVERVRECLSLLVETNREASTKLQQFISLVEKLPAGRLEEVYTGTFDLQVVCYPYVGYQLFGESYRRGAFMVALKERYRACGIPEGSELPDHLALVLRFLGVLDDEAEREEFAHECLIPALEKMAQGFRDKDNPYRELLGALLLLMQEAYPGRPETRVTRPEDFLGNRHGGAEGNESCAQCLGPATASEER